MERARLSSGWRSSRSWAGGRPQQNRPERAVLDSWKPSRLPDYTWAHRSQQPARPSSPPLPAPEQGSRSPPGKPYEEPAKQQQLRTGISPVTKPEPNTSIELEPVASRLDPLPIPTPPPYRNNATVADLDLWFDVRATARGFGLIDYRYEALSADQIRLLIIQPSGDFHSMIQGAMTTTSLKDPQFGARKTNYMALSYTWGPSKPDRSHLSHHIRLNNSKIPVTANLHHALQRVRETVWLSRSRDEQGRLREEHPFFVWVDAVCINQDDASERSRQVALMGRIYAKANKLLIWLGELNHSIGVERASLLKLSRFTIESYDHCDEAMIASGRNARYPRRIQGQVHDAFSANILKSLLRHPWFKRRWVVQEYMFGPLARRFVQIGDIIMCANELQQAFARLIAQDRMNGATLAGPFSLDPHRELQLTLLQNMYNYRSTECSEPHDLAMALLNLSVDKGSHRLDYEQSVAETYLQIASTAVLNRPGGQSRALEVNAQQRQDMQLLAVLACATTHRNRSLYGLPSWVPDWSQESDFVAPEHLAAVNIAMNPRRELYQDSNTLGEDFTNIDVAIYDAIAPVLRNDDRLDLNGWFVHPCFPPKHSEDQCECCRICNYFWTPESAESWSSQFKQKLSCLSRDMMLFVPHGGQLVFCARHKKVGESQSSVWQLEFCFYIEWLVDARPHRKHQLITLA
ncbi:Heterokaryon incompatibility protein 6, OR allele [Pseudocercospora fuligena]|uniref:Heterokaryon incompatibility protein 6, OR allele n=1 Tax=Pseudocercospora fuligena TaxID=685502 RepID=A0A8H6RFS3_9PEZI|nr:Heterokaryon incompatibility protein 6, OR allele [Pseudocercospora fuligena]